VILMSELVQDPRYLEFLKTKPMVPEVSRSTHMSPQWTVYIQKEAGGKWGKKSFRSYKKALKFMFAWLTAGCHDAALNNKRVPFDPPHRWVRIKGKFVRGSDGVMRQATKRVIWKPRLPADEVQHHWCRYCRRPTVFKFYSKHRVLGNCDPTVPRCCICGASARIALTHTDRFFRVH
jgi:hypothetical protein